MCAVGFSPGGAQCTIHHPSCGDRDHSWPCLQQGLAWDHASQGGLRLLPGAEQQHWGRHWSPGAWLNSDSCTTPSTMGSRAVPRALSQPCHGSLAASSYCNPHSPVLPSKTPGTNHS